MAQKFYHEPEISIHALREEGDEVVHIVFLVRNISIHALREEGDGWSGTALCRIHNFNPRPPRGGRRSRSPRPPAPPANFNPRPPRGGRRKMRFNPDSPTKNFNPRPPRGERQDKTPDFGWSQTISIHALREESDLGMGGSFYAQVVFQSTPSARRATSGAVQGFVQDIISIHALREEGDCDSGLLCFAILDFNPRPPRGGRPIRSKS